MPASIARHHADWLSLVEVSGPFLTLPVLTRALPQGLEPVDPTTAAELRRAYEEYQADPSLHGRWARWVLSEILGFDAETLREGPAVPAALAYVAAEHGETLRPDLAVCEERDDGTLAPRLLISLWPPETALDEKLSDRRYPAGPLERAAELLRGTGVRLALVTNGERWTLVHAAAGRPTTYATWEAAVWLDERATLDAFATLLGAHRFFSVAESDTLEALFAESADAEQEVTGQLGRQVRQAVELLVDALSRADREHRGELLRDVSPERLYLASLTVMMRLVFLLCAEERGLFLLGDPLYDQAYAVSALRGQLQEEADRFGEEPLERRTSAWHRLLATFRMVYAGVEHENLRLPPYGGALFDPDRFPFLEGRAEGEPWQARPGRPLPLDDRTVLHTLDALQVLRFQGRGGVTEARRLSFRALDVEQIGHVYEGLLDHTAIQADAPAVGLEGKHEPEIALTELERKAAEGREALVAWLAEQTGRTPCAIAKALAAPLPPHERALLRSACDMDDALAERIAPFCKLLRRDLRGLPQVYLPGGVYVTKTLERRASGTYYTPRSLAEEMVEHALEPLVYEPGPAQGAEREVWRLRPPGELLDIRVCDLAMGSGAFLVACCRYLADRLVEAWAQADDGPIAIDGGPAEEAPDALLVPSDPDDRLVLARRLVAERCLYGVDKNPMAVEMAKLSLWLVTLAKDRPFSFVDHALRCGDSLLGITDLAQLEHLHLDPARGRKLHLNLFDHTSVWAEAVERAVERRRALEAFPVVTLRDAEEKERLLREAEREVEALTVVADVVVAAALSTSSQGPDALDSRLLAVAPEVAAALDPERKEHDREARLESLRWQAVEWLNAGRPAMQEDRRTFHWPLEFPEVLRRGGFDAVVGNPPFQGGKRISGTLGSDYREHLVEHLAGGTKGTADLVAYFFLRAADVVRPGGTIALLATNTIAQGDTREVGLDQLCAAGWAIPRAWKSRPWPGEASLEVAQVWLYRGGWRGAACLDGASVRGITPTLDARSRASGTAYRLMANAKRAFKGSNLNGIGFVVEPREALALIEMDSRNEDVLFPYLNGKDLNTQPDQMGSRCVICFFDWPLERAEAYPLCLEIVRERVKPHRESLPDYKQRVRDRWWQFEYIGRGVFESLQALERVPAIAVVSKTAVPVTAPTGQVFSQDVVVFPERIEAHLGALTSALHWWWTVTRASTMRTDLRYTPTDCFETFPQPELTDEIGRIARALDEHRRALMLARNEGLTKTYNRVHNPDETAADIAELRRLHVELDHAVAAAYGWDDLDLDHGFHETPQGVRFTIGPLARVEVLDRLLELNHERYAAEVARGLHAKGAAKRRRKPPNVVGVPRSERDRLF